MSEGGDRLAGNDRPEIRMDCGFQQDLLDTFPRDQYPTVGSVQDAIRRCCEMRLDGEVEDDPAAAFERLQSMVDDERLAEILVTETSREQRFRMVERCIQLDSAGGEPERAVADFVAWAESIDAERVYELLKAE